MSLAKTISAVRGAAGTDHRLGWTDEQLATRSYARHWKPQMAPLAADVVQAVTASPYASELLPPPALAVQRGLEATAVPTGFTLTADGAMHINVRTPMPGVTPAMIDWWFGWHSDAPERYQLWHPLAHVHASWLEPPAEATSGRSRYVGRTSIVEEYLGAKLGRFSIAFRPPAELGLHDDRLDNPARATAVCARIGPADLPVDVGWLAHLVVADGDGSVMHSRFWIGAPYAAVRPGASGALDAALKLGRKLAKPTLDDARALLVHCAQEMPHLAGFLSALHADEGG